MQIYNSHQILERDYDPGVSHGHIPTSLMMVTAQQHGLSPASFPVNDVMVFLNHLNLELYLSQLRAIPPLQNILFIYDNISNPSPSMGGT